MVFSEFTNKVKFTNRIPYHLQREGISGYTEFVLQKWFYKSVGHQILGKNQQRGKFFNWKYPLRAVEGRVYL